MSEEINKKSNKFIIVILFTALIIAGVVAGKYIIDEFHAQETAKVGPVVEDSGEFNNIESEIFQTNSTDATHAKTESGELNQTEILLKQQLQISELQNNFYALKAEIERVRAGDALSKIILSFVKLQDLVNQKQSYDGELRKLELLGRADFALTKKIDKLKVALETHAKNNLELSQEFAETFPILKAKKVEIDNKGSWVGKFKALITKYITIKKTGENSQTDFDLAVERLKQHIEKTQYAAALVDIESIGPDYQEILATLKIDLQNANDFKQASDEIYKYLEMLSN